MADNLPIHLTNTQVEALRRELEQLGARFANANNLDPERVYHELGFITAHYAAQAGVLNGEYTRWIETRTETSTQGSPVGSEPAAHGGNGGSQTSGG